MDSLDSLTHGGVRGRGFNQNPLLLDCKPTILIHVNTKTVDKAEKEK